MNNNAIDIAFIATKIAAIKDEKARMIVGGASLVYNASQMARYRSMIVELSQICSYIVSKAQIIGSYTQDEYNLAVECQRQIEECNQQIAKHGTMTIIDGISLLIDAFNNLSRR
ncbi:MULTISPECIES: hypothetical protein [Bacteroidales]|uniref:hypothetical protein n=1 Tax=Bacteroidales TaxID=171549 RepID=UPI0006D7FFE8|nr:hypothetical protein [Gabonia massiliensis]